MLTGYEGNAFSSTGSFREDVLSITAVHPMREDAVMQLLQKTKTHENVMTELLEQEMIEKIQYGGYNYYMRKFRK
ncbi:hypothetical protein ES703_95882 [subsurface metagenome]